MESSVVIYSEKMGVFLGVAMGLAFWSKLDAAGQIAAPVFEGKDDAYDFLAQWGAKAVEDLGVVTTVPVAPDLVRPNGMKAASIQACVRAGLPGWLSPTTADQDEHIFGDRPSMH